MSWRIANTPHITAERSSALVHTHTAERSSALTHTHHSGEELRFGTHTYTHHGIKWNGTCKRHSGEELRSDTPPRAHKERQLQSGEELRWDMHSPTVTRMHHKRQRTSDPLNRPTQSRESAGMLAISGGGQLPNDRRRELHFVSHPRHRHVIFCLLCKRQLEKLQNRPHEMQRTSSKAPKDDGC
jgi:hypothetical protein